MTELDKQLKELNRQYFIEEIQMILMLILKYNPLTLIIKFIGRFFYGLFTWQKRVPVYVLTGNSFMTDWLDMMIPDHYEWRKMKTPIQWIKEKFNKTNK